MFLVDRTDRACKSPVLNAVRLMPFLFSPAAAAAAMTTCQRRAQSSSIDIFTLLIDGFRIAAYLAVVWMLL